MTNEEKLTMQAKCILDPLSCDCKDCLTHNNGMRRCDIDVYSVIWKVKTIADPEWYDKMWGGER
jgi:hypothetical protein